ncbi:TetR/AcrR family transcriptional regulator [Bradyrhizobium sp. I71]|uniref:TetR/AcrR family transcriptional regulator n=1 Tax=Bradyrhizobium sp. I71 TaxID=2590772 RepID=UPI001EF9609F|nr:TetR/AcrR family transcriptional regulator [Bradyrhizobium sp. I71]ULK99675.1 TetR/AcrR family transcriptional regulator [Bradyrhizobium sp. I71]
MSGVSGRRGLPSTESRTKRPGRPEGGSGKMRADIMDAAEVIFANQGYAGTTLREISEQAGVTQALITYYFGTKFGLFRETFLRRASVIADARIESLATLRAAGQANDVVAIIEAFLQPILNLRVTAQGLAFLRLHARLHTEPPNLSYELRKTAYDESTTLYIEALHKALPHLSRVDIHWRMTLMIGTYLYALSDTNRMEDMMPEAYDPRDNERLKVETVAFIAGGMRRDEPQRPTAPSKKSRRRRSTGRPAPRSQS